MSTPSNARFTLVELMIVVAIIAILAAVAVPELRSRALDSKKAEIAVNLQGLLDSAVAYQAGFDSWGVNSGTYQPGPYYDKKAHPWNDGTIPSVFSRFDWKPDGDVRASYYFSTDGASYVYALGQSDMDADGDNYFRRDAIDPLSQMREMANVEQCVTSGNPPLDCY
jgi:prepilin-type N-terminal cleavage/methylation domain-containing protein